jgi:hypothetical protein
VERGELRALVARRATRRRRDAARSVGPMARGATPFDVLVLATRFPSMARRARRRASTISRVRLVADHANLVPYGRRGLLGLVARAARRRSLFAVDIRAMTGCTVTVAAVGRREFDLGGVAGRADRVLRGRRKLVRAMARHAGGPRPRMGAIGGCDRGMAGRARRRNGARVHARMWIVTGDARALRPMLDRHVGVTTVA